VSGGKRCSTTGEQTPGDNLITLPAASLSSLSSSCIWGCLPALTAWKRDFWGKFPLVTLLPGVLTALGFPGEGKESSPRRVPAGFAAKGPGTARDGAAASPTAITHFSPCTARAGIEAFWVPTSLRLHFHPHFGPPLATSTPGAPHREQSRGIPSSFPICHPFPQHSPHL